MSKVSDFKVTLDKLQVNLSSISQENRRNCPIITGYIISVYTMGDCYGLWIKENITDTQIYPVYNVSFNELSNLEVINKQGVE
jgi:hypothetical protein